METREEFKLNKAAMEVQNSSTEETPQAKGTANNPFTVAEFEDALATDSWQGGYVEHIGLVAAETNAANFDIGYGGYGDFNFDISDYKDREEHSAGTVDAFTNGNTICAYICINHFFEIGEKNVADLYSYWLEYITKKTKGTDTLSSHELAQIRKRVAGGMTESDLPLFLRDTLGKFGYCGTQTNDREEIKKHLIPQNTWSQEERVRIHAIGLMEHYDLPAGNLHAIKIYRVDGDELIYDDPYEDSTIRFDVDDIKSLIEIKSLK